MLVFCNDMPAGTDKIRKEDWGKGDERLGKETFIISKDSLSTDSCHRYEQSFSPHPCRFPSCVKTCGTTRHHAFVGSIVTWQSVECCIPDVLQCVAMQDVVATRRILPVVSK
jgi:hypothetical protein